MSMYLTVQEFKNAPTGIDCSNIIPGGTQAQSDAELFNIIRRASAWIDEICKQKTLEATQNTETKEVTMNNSGLIRVHPDMMPILSLSTPQYRISPAGPWIDLPLEYIQTLDRYFVIYNLNTFSISSALALQFPTFSYFSPYRIRDLQRIPLTIQYTYINGYPNTLTKDPSPAGSGTIDVINPVGLTQGQLLTIYDNEFTEEITVQSVAGNVVTLSTPTLFDHAANIPISNLPAHVKQACVMLAAYLIKERGALSITMNESSMQGISRYKDASDIDTAKEMLRPFIRGVVS